MKLKSKITKDNNIIIITYYIINQTPLKNSLTQTKTINLKQKPINKMLYKDRKQLSAKIVIIGDAGVGKSSITIRYVYNKFDLKQEATLGAAYMEKICTFQYQGGNQGNKKNKKQKQKQKDKGNKDKEGNINNTAITQQKISSITHNNNINSNIVNSNKDTPTTHNNNTSITHNLKLQIWDTAGQQKYKSISKLYYRDCRVCLLVYDITKKQSLINLNNWYSQLIKHAPKNMLVFVVGNKIDLLQTRIDQENITYERGIKFAEEIQGKYYQVSARNRKGIDQLFHQIAQSIGPIIYNQKLGNNKTAHEANNAKGSFLQRQQSKRLCCKS